MDVFFSDALGPCMLMPVGEKQKKPLHFHAVAGDEQFLKTLRAEIREPFYQLVDLLEAFLLWELVEEFE